MKSPSRLLILLSIVLLPLAASAQAPAADAVRLVVNGHFIDTPGAALMLEDSLFVASGVLVSELGLQARNEKGLWHLTWFEHEFVLRSGERAVTLDGKEIAATLAPLQRGEQLYVPLQLLREALQLTVTHGGEVWTVQSAAATLIQLRQGTHEDRVRFVADLAGPAAFRVVSEPGKVVVELPVAADTPETLSLHQFDDELADQVTESVQHGCLRLTISHKSPEPVQVSTLGDPARIVLDLMREQPVCEVPPTPQPPPGPTQPTPTDIWSPCQFTGARGPVRGFVIRFNPQKTGWTLRPALAGDTIMEHHSVSRMVANNRAYAGINGGFFASQGPPLGMLMIDGEWIKPPLYCRAVLGMGTDGSFHIANVDWSGQVEFAGLGMLPLDGLNEGQDPGNSVTVYSGRWGPVVLGAPDQTRLAVNAAGLVTMAYPPNTDAPVPRGGFVVSGAGTRARTLAGVAQGTHCKLTLDTNPSWPRLRHALGGGPILVDGGRVVLNARAERFREDVAYGSHPRSAVGLTAGGEVVILAVEKPGLTLPELAAVMLKLHCASAMNLDGGGSTTLVVKGRVLNNPADGCERAVSNALLVVKQ